jgi:hypothetical protein
MLLTNVMYLKYVNIEVVGLYSFTIASSSKPLKHVNSEREIGGPEKDRLS